MQKISESRIYSPKYDQNEKDDDYNCVSSSKVVCQENAPTKKIHERHLYRKISIPLYCDRDKSISEDFWWDHFIGDDKIMLTEKNDLNTMWIPHHHS